MAECLRCGDLCARVAGVCPSCLADLRARDEDREARERATRTEPMPEPADGDAVLGTTTGGVRW